MRNLWIVTVLGLACLVGCQAGDTASPPAGSEADAPMPDGPKSKAPRPPFVGSWLSADAQCMQSVPYGELHPLRADAPALAAPFPPQGGRPASGPLCAAR